MLAIQRTSGEHELIDQITGDGILPQKSDAHNSHGGGIILAAVVFVVLIIFIIMFMFPHGELKGMNTGYSVVPGERADLHPYFVNTGRGSICALFTLEQSGFPPESAPTKTEHILIGGLVPSFQYTINPPWKLALERVEGNIISSVYYCSEAIVAGEESVPVFDYLELTDFIHWPDMIENHHLSFKYKCHTNFITALFSPQQLAEFMEQKMFWQR